MIPTRIKTTGDILLTDEVRAYVDQKLVRLEKLIDEEETTNLFEIELAALPPKTGALFRAEINFSSRGKVLRAEAKGNTLHAAIDIAVDDTARRLRHLKTKHSDLLKKGGAAVKDFFRNLGS